MKKILFLIFANLVFLFGLFLICLTVYINRYFGEVSFSQIIFHLSYANNLIVDSDEYIIKKFFQICIYLPIFINIILILITYFLKKIIYKKKTTYFSIKKSGLILSFAMLFIGTIFFANSIKFGKFSSNNYDVIEKYYVGPKNIDYNFTDSKNLVLIYVESLENIFSDKTVFGENLLSEFYSQPYNKIEFKNLKQTILTNWTIASIVASQCGLPLKNVGIFSFGKNKGKHQRQVFGMKKFLPNAFCLGEVLKIGNYKNVFISSPNVNFSGTGNFFKTHGYDEVYGKEEYDSLGYLYEGSSWGNGPNDSFLFNFSIDRIDKLINKEKFNITILTTDTHEPKGFLDPNCKHKEHNLNNVIKCTSEELFKFVKYIDTNYGDKINIVIFGDHQFRFKNNREIFKDKERSIFNRFISNEDKKIYRNTINYYDLFPTIVDFIDVKFNDKRLGIGVSGFKEVDNDIYLKRFNQIEENVLNRSNFYELFWKN